MKKLIGTMLLCAAALAGGVAHGHGAPMANHGGVVMAVGETWLELVVRPDRIELYMEDDGDPIDSAGVSGKLTVAGKTELALLPAGGNKLKTATGLALPKGTKVSALLLMADKKTKVATTFVLQ